MPIAAISSSFVSAVRELAQAAVEPASALRRSASEQRDGGRRHDLVDAMSQVLGLKGPQDASGEQAVFRFAHALMHDLRSIDGAPERDGQATDREHDNGRGNGWGRREWNDLAQRLDALATAASATAAKPAAVPSPPVPSAAAGAPDAPATVPETEVPPQPNPITTNSAALHLMQVPSSRLLEAYVALRKALGEQASNTATGAPRDELAAFLERLSKELATDASAALPAGSVLNLTA